PAQRRNFQNRQKRRRQAQEHGLGGHACCGTKFVWRPRSVHSDHRQLNQELQLQYFDDDVQFRRHPARPDQEVDAAVCQRSDAGVSLTASLRLASAEIEMEFIPLESRCWPQLNGRRVSYYRFTFSSRRAFSRKL